MVLFDARLQNSFNTVVLAVNNQHIIPGVKDTIKGQPSGKEEC